MLMIAQSVPIPKAKINPWKSINCVNIQLNGICLGNMTKSWIIEEPHSKTYPHPNQKQTITSQYIGRVFQI